MSALARAIALEHSKPPRRDRCSVCGDCAELKTVTPRARMCPGCAAACGEDDGSTSSQRASDGWPAQTPSADPIHAAAPIESGHHRRAAAAQS